MRYIRCFCARKYSLLVMKDGVETKKQELSFRYFYVSVDILHKGRQLPNGWYAIRMHAASPIISDDGDESDW